MSQAYFGTWVLRAPGNTDPSLIAQARKLAGQLVQRRHDSGVQILHRRIRLADGTVITALLNGTMPIVTITTPQLPDAVQAQVSNLWIPRGFVVYPAWTSAPLGVGLPIIQKGDGGPYDAVNVAPGLDQSRWTAGGPLGEVLMSGDLEAGYQTEQVIPVPLLFDDVATPQFTWNTSYDAQALTGTWDAYRLELAPFVNQGNGANPTEQLSMFEGINALRVGAGVPAALLRLRGYARMGEITSTLISANGSTSTTGDGFPESYATPADRLTKDGYAADWMTAAFPTFNRSDVFTGDEFFAVGTGESAVAQWQADPTLGPELLQNFDTVICDAGFSNGYCAAVLNPHDRWIAAGNMGWQSTDPSLPPLSWHGFAGLALGWETYRANYSSDPTAPLTVTGTFTDSNGDPWLAYTRSKTPTSSSAEPCMGRHIYSRGRAIAMAPEGALVWGACVIRNTTAISGGSSVPADRLILLAHHSADQSSDTTNQGFTRYLRVWWADIPQRPGLALDPELVICGTDTTDPLSWRGGTLVDLGQMPVSSNGGFVAATAISSIKMASQWRFSPNGTRAVCLRDYGSYTDYKYLNNVNNSSSGLYSRAVELVFSVTGSGLNVQTVFHDYTAGAFWTYEGALNWPTGAKPLAVDYTSSNNLVYAYVAGYYDESPVGPNADATFYAGTGDATVSNAGDMSQSVMYGSQNAYQGTDFEPYVINCVDVNRAAFVVHGTHAFKQGAAIDGVGLTPNPNFVCWPFTTALAHGVRMLLGGKVVHEDWYPVPDGALITQSVPCSYLESIVFLPCAISDCVQPYWAERFGEYVFSYQVSPTPFATIMLDGAPDNPEGPCGCLPSGDNLSQPNSYHTMAFDELLPRGGHAVSSLDLPAADWFIYAKAV